MRLFAIADLHLAMGVEKPMDIFGNHWENHSDKLSYNWKSKIKSDDLIVIPGDISWGISLEQAKKDLEFLDNLPGIKILSKGNHDYWWTTVNKIQRYFEENNMNTFKLLKNNCFQLNSEYVLCGARGWILPCDNLYTKAEEKIYLRELGRLKLSLDCAKKEFGEEMKIIVALHYPPLLAQCKETEFTKLMEEYNVEFCVYGHVHKNGIEKCFEGVQNKIKYTNISADKIDFNPLCIKG